MYNTSHNTTFAVHLAPVLSHSLTHSRLLTRSPCLCICPFYTHEVLLRLDWKRNRDWRIYYGRLELSHNPLTLLPCSFRLQFKFNSKCSQHIRRLNYLSYFTHFAPLLHYQYRRVMESQPLHRQCTTNLFKSNRWPSIKRWSRKQKLRDGERVFEFIVNRNWLMLIYLLLCV